MPDNDYASPLDNRKGVILKAENSLKDEDLMSGRLNYLLDPVMFPQQSTEVLVDKNGDYPINGLISHNTKMNKQVSEHDISPEDSVGIAMNLTRKMETTSTRKHVGRESTMGHESGLHNNRDGSPYQSKQRLMRAGIVSKKQPKDFNKMSHYEIMQHIEGAALRQRLNQSKQRNPQTTTNMPTSDVNIETGQ